MTGSDARWDGHFWQYGSRCETDKRFPACGRAGGQQQEPRVGCAKWGGRERVQPSAQLGSARTDCDSRWVCRKRLCCTAPSLAPGVETDFMSAEMIDDLPTPSSPISATRISRGAILPRASGCVCSSRSARSGDSRAGGRAGSRVCAEAIANGSSLGVESLSLSLSRDPLSSLEPGCHREASSRVTHTKPSLPPRRSSSQRKAVSLALSLSLAVVIAQPHPLSP